MSVLMVVLKSIIILLLNVILAYGFVWLVKLLLVVPLHKKHFRNKHIPLTPGLLIKLRNKWYKKISNYYYEYMKNAENSDERESVIAKWEEKVYHKCWNKVEFIDNIPLLTENMRTNVKHWISLLGYEMAKQFLRSFIPFVFEKFNTNEKLLTLDNATSPKIIQQYYNKFVHKYLIIFFLIVSSIVGIINMIFFLILH